VFFDDVKNHMQRAVFGLVFAPRQLAGGAAGYRKGDKVFAGWAPFGVWCGRRSTSSAFGLGGAIRAASSGDVRSGSGRRVCSHTGCRGIGQVVSTAGLVPRCTSGLRAGWVPGRFFADKAHESNESWPQSSDGGWTTDSCVDRGPEVRCQAAMSGAMARGNRRR